MRQENQKLVQGLQGLQSEYLASLGNLVRLYLKVQSAKGWGI